MVEDLVGDQVLGQVLDQVLDQVLVLQDQDLVLVRLLHHQQLLQILRL